MEQVSWEKEIPHKKAAFTFSEGIKSDIKARSQLAGISLQEQYFSSAGDGLLSVMTCEM